MALPTSRNTTYAAGSQVKSADLNDLQDEVVTLHGASFNAAQTVTLGYSDFQAGAGWTADSASQNWSSSGAGGYLVATIPILAGHRISAATLYVKDTADWPIHGKLFEIDVTTGSTAVISDVMASEDSGVYQAIVVRGITTSAKASTKLWQVWFDASTHAGLIVLGAAITFVK